MKPFQILSENEEYRDGDRFSVIRAKLKTPEDKEVNWAYIKGRDGVIVVALDKDKNVYIKKEWRLTRKDFVWELPSGWIEKVNPTEDDVLESANRELQEEVGVKGTILKSLGSFYVMNHSTSKFHVVLATGLVPSSLAKDDHEHLTAELVSFKEGCDRLLLQQIPNAQIVIALQWAKDYFSSISTRR